MSSKGGGGGGAGTDDTNKPGGSGGGGGGAGDATAWLDSSVIVLFSIFDEDMRGLNSETLDVIKSVLTELLSTLLRLISFDVLDLLETVLSFCFVFSERAGRDRFELGFDAFMCFFWDFISMLDVTLFECFCKI